MTDHVAVVGERASYPPHYGKILRARVRGTEDLLSDPVVVEEKVDGSMFRFGCAPDGSLHMASRRAAVYPETTGMFQPAIDHVVMLYHAGILPKGVWFFTEFVGKPKHNTQEYETVPLNNLVLFDVMYNGALVEPDPLYLDGWADSLMVSPIPILAQGHMTWAKINALLSLPSFLGGANGMEGVVVKNYARSIALGSATYPMFCKLVAAEFAERHQTRSKREGHAGKETEYFESFAAEPRWRKAVERLRDEDRLQGSPHDIGGIIAEIQSDLEIEEKEAIMQRLWKMHQSQIKRAAVRGFAEWYKARLDEEFDAATKLAAETEKASPKHWTAADVMALKEADMRSAALVPAESL